MSWRQRQQCCFSVALRKATKRSNKCWLGISCWLLQLRFGNVLHFSWPSEFSISFCDEISCSFHLIAMALTRKDCECDGGDFFFYASFGLVVTIFVRIAGVLLVFSYLIVPAVCGINLAGDYARGCSLAGSLRRSEELAACSGPSTATCRRVRPLFICKFGVLLVIVSSVGLLKKARA